MGWKMNDHMIRGAIFAFLDYELGTNELMYYKVNEDTKNIVIEYYDNGLGWPQEALISFEKLSDILEKQIKRLEMVGNFDKMELTEGYRDYWKAYING